jgi:hypothetical protein
VEDIFFILEKVLTRSLSLYLPTSELQIQSASLPFSICGQMIEHLDPPISDGCEAEAGAGGVEDFCLYSLLTNKDLYLAVATHIPSPLSHPNHPAAAQVSSESDAGSRAGVQGIGAMCEEDNDPDLEVSDVVEYASAIGADLAVGTLAFAGAAGGWLASFAGPVTSSVPSPSSAAAPTSPTKTPPQSSQPISPSSGSSRKGEREAVMATGVVSAAADEFLSHRDAAIYINSVTIAVLSIANLSLLLQEFLPPEATLPSNPLLLSVTVPSLSPPFL